MSNIKSLTAKVTLIFMLLVSPIAFSQEVAREGNASDQRLETPVSLTRADWVKYHADQIQLDKDYVLNLQKLDANLFCLAQSTFFEARGESLVGKVAVSQVVMNRTNHPDFPSTICGVVRQANFVTDEDGDKTRVCQFSWYCAGSGKIPLYSDGKLNQAVYRQWYDSVVASIIAYKGMMTSVVGNATYFTHKNVKAQWTKRFQKIETIENHTFLGDKTKK